MGAVKNRPKLAQDEFDEAVKTNKEDFGMEDSEAVASALEEFKMQGYDLTGVIASATATDLSKHPVTLTTQALKERLAAGGSAPELHDAVRGLDAALSQLEGGQAASLADKAGTVPALVSVAKALFSPPLSADVSAALAATLMRAAKLMGYEDLRAAFAAAGGLEDLMSMLTALTAAAAADAHTGTQDVLEAVLMLATAASLREEKSKCKLMDSGFVDLVVSRLLAREDTPVVLLIPAAAVVRSVTTGDDEKEYTSKAFIHARTLASTVSAHKVLLALLRRLGASPAADHAGVMVSLLTSLRQVAANEEICRELGDDGCVATCLGIATGWAATWEVVTAATNLLRQMAGSDGIKKILSEQRGIETALAVQSSHKQAEVVEAVLGLLATTSLRHPEICDQMAQAGCPDMVVDVMGDYAASAPVMRQACMLVRNMVVRNAHLRPVFLEKGVEARLRSAKAAHPASCKDVGAAALRDLGLDNYND